MLLKIALLTFLLLCARPFSAGAETPPPEISATIPSAALHGRGVLGFLWFDAYQATLWSGGAWQWQQPFGLSIVYEMAFTSDELVDRSITEMQRAYTDAQAESTRADLIKALPAVNAGDRLTAVFLPPARTLFYKNGAEVHAVEGQQFAEMFFNIWLGEATSAPDLRRALLAQGD